MAEEQDYSGWGASGYIPRTEWSNVPFYKNNSFSNPLDAEAFIAGTEFQSFWNKQNLTDEQIGFRVKTSANALDAMSPNINTYGRRDYKSLIDKRASAIERAKANFKPNPNLIREIRQSDGSMLRMLVPAEEQIARYNYNMDNGLAQIKNLSRIENRFYTPLTDIRNNLGIDGKGLSAYIRYSQDYQKSGHYGAKEARLPISMVSDKNLQRWSLRDFEPFDGVNGGLKDGDFMKQMRGIENSGEKIGERYGIKLGARISSNPQHEVFVPASVGHSARRVGYVDTDQRINIVGPADEASQWAARGKQALNIGGKALLVAGVVGETINTQRRMQGYYDNALRNDPNWNPDISDKIGMAFAAGTENALNFGTIGLWDQKERIFDDMTSGAGYGKGYYGTMAPPSGTTSVHYNPESRYERQGVSFNHLYPKAP